jgi:hypothetical protein
MDPMGMEKRNFKNIGKYMGKAKLVLHTKNDLERSTMHF